MTDNEKLRTAIQEIKDAIEASAAPMNAKFALAEMAREGIAVTLDAQLLLDLLQASEA